MSLPVNPQTAAPEEQASSKSATALIGTGITLALLGVLGLAFAAEHAPTLMNALTEKWVLKPQAYVLLRLISFAGLGGGLLLAFAGVIQHAQSTSTANRQR